MLQARHPVGLNQSFIDVPGIAHQGNKTLTSACGRNVPFGKPGG